MEGKKKYIIIGVISGVLGIFILLLILLAIQESQNSGPREYEQPVLNETFAVNAGQATPYYARIEISDKKYNRIEGVVEEKSGHGINFMILDTKNYNAWKEDNSSAMAYVKEKNITNYNFSFIPDHSDDYYFVFDNTNSIFTNKLVAAQATWKYRQ